MTKERFPINTKSNPAKLTITALLTAIAILIPLVMPVRAVIGPASFTLASHVPIFFAMFLSPGIAVAVSLGSAIGFLLSGLPIVISMRALSHVVFAFIGSLYIQKKRESVLESVYASQFFSFWIAFIHALAEVLVVSVFFFGIVPGAEYEDSFFYAVFLLVGVGTIVHSMIDFVLAQILWRGMGTRVTNRLLKRIRE
jgi:niacin transporter